MLTLELNSKTVKLYDDIESLPVKLFNLANEYSMQDFEIGNQMADVDRHENRIEVLLVNNKIPEAIQVQKNKRMAFFAMINHINYRSLMFACHIHSIDDVVVTDYSPENLQKIIDQLSDDGLTMAMVNDHLDRLKKKLKSN
jgi:ketopantoate reductase